MGLSWDDDLFSAGYVAHLSNNDERMVQMIRLSSAGYVAHSMGLPIRMVAAVTPNDIVHRTLQVGKTNENQLKSVTIAKT